MMMVLLDGKKHKSGVLHLYVSFKDEKEEDQDTGNLIDDYECRSIPISNFVLQCSYESFFGLTSQLITFRNRTICV